MKSRLFLGFALPVALFAGCSSTTVTPASDAGTDAGEAPAVLALAEGITCKDTIDSIYADPGTLTPGDASRGKILKCAEEAEISKDQLLGYLTALKYKGTIANGAKVYRVLYQTTRGDGKGSVGYSSAKVFVPNVPVVASKVATVVVASGTRGQAGKCAVSKTPVDDKSDPALTMAYSAVGAGQPVVLHDGAGYANYGAKGNPMPGYAFSDDVGRSMLDGARAAKNLFSSLSTKAELIGHSHGGHMALSALSMMEGYGAGIDIVAVSLHAPFWISQRGWGSMLNRSVAQSLGLTVAASDLTSGIAVWYHYIHAELLDGEGAGISLFKPEKQAAIKKYLDDYCLFDPSSTQLTSVGVEYIAEAFAQPLVDAVRDAAPGLGECSGEGKDLCEKWMKRYAADRPHLTGKAKAVPILVTYGTKDTTIPANRMSCATDRLTTDGASFKMCYRDGASHQGIVPDSSEYVSAWLKAKAAGTDDPPEECATVPAATECATPPPND
ncbi:MAG: hypothetical protein U0174_11555 [Polyangiaceae bacterium]